MWKLRGAEYWDCAVKGQYDAVVMLKIGGSPQPVRPIDPLPGLVLKGIGRFCFYFVMRIFLTKLFALIPLALLICGNSHWTGKSPFVAAILFVAGIMSVGVAILGRLWCSLYIAGRKDRILVVHGPYSLSRNPFYQPQPILFTQLDRSHRHWLGYGDSFRSYDCRCRFHV